LTTVPELRRRRRDHDAEWERVWREADDEFLIESAKDHLWQNLQSPQPGFNRFSQICREAHRRGKPELLLQAGQRLVPVRTASGEDLRDPAARA
jgi:hypothetical protein